MSDFEKSLFDPKAIAGFSRKTVVYIPVDSASGILKKYLIKNSLKHKSFLFTHLFLLTKRVVLYGCIGAPAAVLILETLIASGAEEIILLGLCGSLSQRTRLFDVVSIEEAFSEEGTSQHYLPSRKEFFPSKVLRYRLETKIKAKGLPFLSGSIVSTDAPYRETKSWLLGKLNKGIDCVDMETSAVFCLAEYHKIQAAALMLVSDELSLESHNVGFTHPQMDASLSEYFLPFIRDP